MKNIILNKKIIDFSCRGTKIDNKIENYINNSILNSYDVNRFDAKAYFIIRQLFKAYYSNPRQMPKELLDELSKRIHNNSQYYECEIKLEINSKDGKDYKLINNINFEDSSPIEIDELLKFLKLEMTVYDVMNWRYKYKTFKLNLKNILKSLGHDMDSYKHFKSKLNGTLEDTVSKKNYKSTLEGVLDEIKSKKPYYSYDEKIYEKKLLENSFREVIKQEDIHKILNVEERAKLLFLRCMLEQHYAYISIICDHIAMMTDNYAKNEYERLYLI